MPNALTRFSEYELDHGRFELRRGEEVLKLEKIPMELLFLLVESNGQLVTRDQIVERIWGKNAFLDTEHGINTAIRKIRQALGDDPEQPRFVQTVTGKGYRFIAETLAPNADAAQESVRPTSGTASLQRRAALLIGVFVLVLAALLAFNVAGLRTRFSRGTAPGHIHSLAVLPLENLSGDPSQDYFADGMTDELITMLAKNPGLRVISRTSVMQYKNAHRPLPQIAKELGVDGILEGSVGRSAGRVHINAQLIYAPTDTHLWAESYDRDLTDVGALQSDLARTIAQQVGLSASPAPPPRAINPEAHDAFLRGRYLWAARDYDGARAYLEKATQIQPDYAPAWAGIADYYTASAAEGNIASREALAHAEPAARKALALDDTSGEAHRSMAAVYYFLRWDWTNAEREITRSLVLNPLEGESHHLHAYILQTLQKTEESIAEDRKVMELDPFARPWALGFAYLRARQYDAGLDELRLRREAQPSDCVLHTGLATVYFHKRMASEFFEESRQCAGPKATAALQQAFQRAGITGVLEWNLMQLKKDAQTSRISPFAFASIYCQLGKKDDCLRALEQSYQEREAWLVHIQNEDSFDVVHDDPRYRAIVKKMELPPAS